MEVSAGPQISAARTMLAAGTPVIASVRAGCIARQAARLLRIPCVCASMKLRIDPSAFDHDVEDSVGQRAVASGTHRQEEVCGARDRRHAGIDDDDLCAVVARSPDVVGQDREAFADVRPGDDDRLRQRNVAPWIGGAVDAERHLVGGACADHAEPAVVVDVGRAQRDARELADQVRLFIRHRGAAQHRERIAAVLRLDLANRLDGAIQRFIPCGFAKTVVRADQRREQAVRMFVLQVALYALGAEHAAVDRKLFPRLESDDLVVMNLELNAALNSAEAAVRLHERAIRMLRPSAGRLVVEMWTVAFDEPDFVESGCCHDYRPSALP